MKLAYRLSSIVTVKRLKGIEARPALIKPNAYELSLLTGVDVKIPMSRRIYAGVFIPKPAFRCCVRLALTVLFS